MDKYIIINICLGAGVIIIITAFYFVCKKLLRNKENAQTFLIKCVCGILAVSFVAAIICNMLFISRKNEINNNLYRLVNDIRQEDIYIYDEQKQQFVESPNLSVYAKYYNKYSIPKYKKFETIKGDIKYTYYIRDYYSDNDNGTFVEPNLIMFVEYTGNDKIIWGSYDIQWFDNEESSQYSSQRSASSIIMLYGGFNYNTRKIRIEISYSMDSAPEGIYKNNLTISCK